MLKQWIQRHRNFLKKNGGMEEKKLAIEFQNRVSERVKEQLNKLSIEHPTHTRITDGQSAANA